MLPFEGIKILDFSQAMFGPVCTRLLADWGAEVIKVEPLEGDFTRISPRGRDATAFLSSNRNKDSLAVNTRHPKGLEIVLKLASETDVIVENFRPGVMDGMGFGYEAISKINPKVIYGSFSAYGEKGPMTRWKGGDIWAQGMTGVVASQGNPDGPPYLAGHFFLDYGGAVLNALGIASALFMREKTGKGQKVTNNMLNSGTFLQEYPISYYLNDGVLYKKGGRGNASGIFPYGAYKAKDGDVVTMFGQDDDEWTTVCLMLGLEHLLANERYDKHAKRIQHKTELYPILDEAFSKKTRAEWQEIFHQNGLRCDPCLDYSEYVTHPQFEANEMLEEIEHPRYGTLKMVSSPVKLSGIEHIKRDPPPLLGEHTEKILRGMGYSDDEIKQLEAEGAIGILKEIKVDDSAPRNVTENVPTRKRADKNK